MELYYKCKDCRSLNNLDFKATDRGRVRELYPDGISCRCNHCERDNIVGPNEIVAREGRINSIAMIIGLLMSVLIGICFIKCFWANDLGRDIYVLAVFGAVISLPPIVAGAIVKSGRKNIKLFNSYYV